MLKFYYSSLSPNARRVWLTLLEKGIPFEPVLLNLDGDQFQPEFVAINPFHHGSQQLTLADIVAGTVVPLLPKLGVPLNDHPKLYDWCGRDQGAGSMA